MISRASASARSPELVADELAQILGHRPVGLDGEDPEVAPVLVADVHAGGLLFGPGRHRRASAPDPALTRVRVATRCKSVRLQGGGP
jgi:hypothetical protein